MLKMKKTEIVRDSAIKRLELCYDLAWKSIKKYAADQGMECYSPRECFKNAFQLKIINKEDEWLEMINGRNLAAYLYNEKSTDKIFIKLPDYLKLIKGLIFELK